jgi:predicted metal-dependent hydrolase
MLPAIAERLARQHMEQAPAPAASAEELAPQFREEVLETARRAAAAASRQQIQTEGRAMLEVELRPYLAGEGRVAAERLVASLGQEMLPAMAERLARQHLEQLPGSLAARVEALVPQLREQMLETARRAATAASRQQIEVEGRGALEAAIRQYLASEGEGLAERLVATLAGEAVPAIAERLVQRELDRLPNPGVKLEELLAHLREQLREDARRGVEAIARRYVESSGRTVVEEVIRQYAGSQGVEVAEELIRAATREIVPTIAERLVQRELERLPGPAAKVEEVLANLREQLREDARRAIETIARRYAETDGRATVESVIRQYVATQGVGLADDFVRAAAREIVPTVAERLVQREIAHLPPAAARIEEVLAQLREQLREDGRRAIETIARRYAETEGRGAIEAVIRHQLGTPGGAVADDLVRSVAREVVPTIAERLIREEIARLRRDVRPG